jgi:alpha-L-fucosidase
MKNIILIIIAISISFSSVAQDEYKPSPENLKNREWFQNAKFGLFVHWGVYSILANGEWVMQETRIPIKQYEKLPSFFNPQDFDPAEWVAMVKKAGMNYIVITSKHHDGFAMYDSKVSDYDIADKTPYGKDVLKMLADECKKEDIKLFFYYSHLDWHHPEFYRGGRTGGDITGRQGEGNFPAYIDYMNAQLTELLTGYGEIGGIWFDGIWDKLDADWQLRKTYDLIHKLQPGCLVGNNHHIGIIPGEDFQMFEKDLPGHNSTGWAPDQSIGNLPFETCETISGNGSWGFNIYDKKTKTPDDLIKYMVKAAGYNSNFLLNVGPMPNGNIQPEHVEVLDKMGEWMDKYGETIYGTRGGPFDPRPWGVSTQKENKIFIHILDWSDPMLVLPPLPQKITKAIIYGNGEKVTVIQDKEKIILRFPAKHPSVAVQIIQMELN